MYLYAYELIELKMKWPFKSLNLYIIVFCTYNNIQYTMYNVQWNSVIVVFFSFFFNQIRKDCRNITTRFDCVLNWSYCLNLNSSVRALYKIIYSDKLKTDLVTLNLYRFCVWLYCDFCGYSHIFNNFSLFMGLKVIPDATQESHK